MNGNSAANRRSVYMDRGLGVLERMTVRLER